MLVILFDRISGIRSGRGDSCTTLSRTIGSCVRGPTRPIVSQDLKSSPGSDIWMNAYNSYRKTQTETAAPGELVVMLYRGASRFLASAIQALEVKDLQTGSNQLLRAQAVINELLETLDLKRGGEIAQNLNNIYEYMNFRLVDANMRKDAAPAREVEHLLRELLPSWEQIARQTATAPARNLVEAAA
jgi:flagellar secretion chaperone FliS